MSRICRSGRTWSSCARRRRLPVPTGAPGGRWSSDRYFSDSRASATAARSGTAARQSPGDRVGRQVLQAMDGQVDAAGQQLALDFLGEHAPAADRADGRLLLVAAGRHRRQFDLDPQGPQLRGHPLCLPLGQRARSGAKADQRHRGLMRVAVGSLRVDDWLAGRAGFAVASVPGGNDQAATDDELDRLVDRHVQIDDLATSAPSGRSRSSAWATWE